MASLQAAPGLPAQAQASNADTNASNEVRSATVSQSSEGQGSAIQPARSLEEESALSAAEADGKMSRAYAWN